jgi:hypothetical protein
VRSAQIALNGIAIQSMALIALGNISGRYF